MKDTAPQINIVIPLYNEEKVFNELVRRLSAIIDSSELSVGVIMVDDGSSDSTPTLMQEVSFEDRHFTSVFLSRNFGHQRALTAGLSCVNATEAALIIDGDLQDPPELLDNFYTYLKEGYEVVYAVRKKRKETFWKRFSYKVFYKLLKNISYHEMPLDAGDFALISRRVIEHMNQMPEESRFLRGIRSWIGFKQIGIQYEREERHSGESKYNLKRLIDLALNGIFNFSQYPIKFITYLGLITASLSMIYFGVTLVKKLWYNVVPEGFTALLFMIILFGGVQLVAIGIIGEYVLRIFFQVKQRPLFIIKDIIKNKETVKDKIATRFIYE